MRNLEKLAEEVKAAMEEMSGKKVKIYHGLNRNGKSMTGFFRQYITGGIP